MNLLAVRNVAAAGAKHPDGLPTLLSTESPRETSKRKANGLFPSESNVVCCGVLGAPLRNALAGMPGLANNQRSACNCAVVTEGPPPGVVLRFL
jgi:hypothetical protein